MRKYIFIVTLKILLVLGACLNALAAPFAYITNSGSNNVSVIDTATNKVTATIPVGTGPAGVAGYPAGHRVYVANRGSGTVSVIDTTNNTVIATITVGPYANAVAVKPDGSRLYVTYGNVPRGFGLAYGNLAVINLATNTVFTTKATTFALGFSALAVNPAGTRLYLSNGAINLTVMDTATNADLAYIRVTLYDRGVAVNPAGTRVYVANPGLGSTNSNLLVVDTATNTVIATIPPGILTTAHYPSGPLGVAVNPAGTRVYVTGSLTFGGTGYVLVFDTATNAVIATIPVGTNPQGVAVNPAGTGVYVANTGSNNVSVIDTSTNKVTATIPVGSAPIGLGIIQLQTDISVALTPGPTNSQIAGTPQSFTAAASGGSGSYEYRFWLNAGAGFSIIQDYSAANTLVWTPATSGAYDILVDVRNVGSTADREASIKLFYYEIAPAVTIQVSVTPSLASPQAPGTAITFTATGKGGSGSYEFRFWLNSGSGYNIVQAYSAVNTLVWTPATTGNYDILVDVRNTGSTAFREALTKLFFYQIR